MFKNYYLMALMLFLLREKEERFDQIRQLAGREYVLKFILITVTLLTGSMTLLTEEEPAQMEEAVIFLILPIMS